VASYLIVLSRGRVQVAGEVAGLLASHRTLIGPAAAVDRYAERPAVNIRRDQENADLLVRATAADPVPHGFHSRQVGLEELAMAYLRLPRAATAPAPSRTRNHETTQVTK
jgi:ABC-2 type transport system ATP-binding protein